MDMMRKQVQIMVEGAINFVGRTLFIFLVSFLFLAVALPLFPFLVDILPMQSHVWNDLDIKRETKGPNECMETLGEAGGNEGRCEVLAFLRDCV
jgi:hypothetical protein